MDVLQGMLPSPVGAGWGGDVLAPSPHPPAPTPLPLGEWGVEMGMLQMASNHLDPAPPNIPLAGDESREEQPKPASAGSAHSPLCAIRTSVVQLPNHPYPHPPTVLYEKTLLFTHSYEVYASKGVTLWHLNLVYYQYRVV